MNNTFHQVPYRRTTFRKVDETSYQTQPALEKMVSLAL